MRSPPAGLPVLLLCWSLLLAGSPAHGDGLRFFALGDMPYSAAEVAPMRRLIEEGVRGGSPFIVHLGDIKAGGSPCTDEGLERIAGIFRSVPVPLVYTPGDNEWTDCHRASAGGHDPLARLGRVREVFFRDPGVLRLRRLGVVDQSPDYPENLYFQRSGVMLVALHVVGSHNGRDRDRPASMAEFEARDAANRAFLDRALEAALDGGAEALVILMQADPRFGRSWAMGYRPILRAIAGLPGRFDGPILLLHGDSHRFIHDRPFTDPDTGATLRRLVRVQVPGSPILGGVWIGLDPSAAEPFAVEPVYSVSLERLAD